MYLHFLNIISSRLSILPAGYGPLRGIKSTGTQYLKLVSTSTPQSNIKIRFQNLAYVNYAAILGYFWSGSEFCLLQNFYSYIRVRSSTVGGEVSLYRADLDSLHEVEFGVNGVKLDGATITTNSYAFVGGRDIFAFAYDGIGQGKSKCIIEEIIHESNGVVREHLYPCIRLQDNVVGMYDAISGTFITNLGTGAFIAIS